MLHTTSGPQTAPWPDTPPGVGDWVRWQRPASDAVRIDEILPRFSNISRKAAGRVTEEQIMAANVDWIFLVSSLNQEFSANRLERYLTMAWQSGASPVILLSKADLCEEITPFLDEAEQAAPAVPVHPVSTLSGEGIEAITPYLERGKTIVLLGSSGVGKSTLVNQLAGGEQQKTGTIRQQDERGRHTTTYRTLIPLREGAVLIDTPGLRELALWGDEAALGKTFDDIESLATGCRFADCGHRAEPGCAVRTALEDGRLQARRLESYHKLLREFDHLRAKETQGTWQERRHKKETARIHKEAKRFKAAQGK